jgi:hypothetical protein
MHRRVADAFLDGDYGLDSLKEELART